MCDSRARPYALLFAIAVTWAASPAYAQIDSALAAQLATDAPVIDLVAADNRTCARLRDGSWKCWGEALAGAGHGQCGTAACDPTPIAAYPKDFRYIIPKTSGCGVEQSGAVQCWGAWAGGNPRPTTITAPHAARVIGLSDDQLCVGSSDNQIACRRRGSQQWKALPYNDVVSLAVSDTRVGLVRHAHILTVWDGEKGADFNLPTRFVMFGPQVTYALSRQWGAYVVPDQGEPRAIPGLERVVHLASDPTAQHICASIGTALAGTGATGGNAVRCRGPNNAGQLGTGDTQSRSTFEDVAGMSGAMRVAVGTQHSCALTIKGDVYCWGANNLGQLGVHLEPEQPTVKRTKAKGTFTNLATGVSVKAHSCGQDLPCALSPVRVPVTHN